MSPSLVVEYYTPCCDARQAFFALFLKYISCQFIKKGFYPRYLRKIRKSDE
nr:MAG TPA: hypothetical protein [Bacteriophage sp.]